MKIPDPRWSANVYAEIFRDDCYRLKRRIPVTPTAVYDIGANLGVFTNYAKQIWPSSKVVCIEPNQHNFSVLLETTAHLSSVVAINAALGTGPVRWLEAIGGNANPGGHSYLCECVGYSRDDIQTLSSTDCMVLSLDELFQSHPSNGEYLVKIDVEGAEECLFDHTPSNQVLRNAIYWTAELHFFAARAREIPNADRLAPALLGTHGHVIRACLDWCYGFSDTHKVELELLPNSGMVWCTRR